jgi:hypothetical protein
MKYFQGSGFLEAAHSIGVFMRIPKLLSFLMIFVSAPAFGFKIKTHVYLGQEVINDLKACSAAQNYPCVHITKKDGTVVPATVDAAVAQAILKHEKTFLTGTIGPDGFADVLSGQVTIHPGITNDKHQTSGFGTGDWVNHLLVSASTSEELAFAYGFAGHAAADTFAHSYVNQYAGDVYELTDKETDVEERHMMVETFIADHTPGLQDGSGRDLPDTFAYLGGETDLFAPLPFIRKTLVANPSAKAQNSRSGGAQHLVALDDVSSELNRSLYKKNYKIDVLETAKKYALPVNAQQPLNKWIAETYQDLEGAGSVQKIEVLILQIVAYKLGYLQLSAAEAAKAAEAANHLNGLLNRNAKELVKIKDQIMTQWNKIYDVRNQAIKDGAQAAVKATADLQAELGRFIELQLEYERKAADAVKKTNDYLAAKGKELCKEAQNTCHDLPIDESVQVLVRFECEKTRQVKKLVDSTCPREEINKVCGRLGKALGKVCKNVTKTVWTSCQIEQLVTETYKAVCERWDWTKQTRWVEDTTCKAVREACKAQINQQLLALQALEEQMNLAIKAQQYAADNLLSQENVVNKAAKKLSESVAYVADVESRARRAMQVFETNSMTSIIDMAATLRGHFERWKNETHVATEDWIRANAQAMVYSTSSTKDAVSAFEPIQRWMNCRLPVLVGVPKSTMESFCGPIDQYFFVMKEIDRFETDIIKSFARSEIPGISFVSSEILKIKQDGPFLVTAALQQQLDNLFGPGRTTDIHLMHHAIKSRHDDGKMIKKFAEDESHGKQLLLFPKQPGQGTIIERLRADMGIDDGREKFEVKEFAPAHNALQLMKLSLLSSAGLNDFMRKMGVAKAVYGADVKTILGPWLRSIDGNHQWLEMAPPYLRRTAFADRVWLNAFCNDPSDQSRRFSKGAFPLFASSEIREPVFNEIFNGPLAPGLELTHRDFVDLRPAEHLYLATESDPFPVFNVKELDSGRICQGIPAPQPGSNSGTTQQPSQPGNPGQPAPARMIFESETAPAGTGFAWDGNNSSLVSSNLNPYQGGTHLRASLNSKDYWGAAAYNFSTDWNNNLDISKAKTLTIRLASASGPQRILLQFYGQDNSSDKVAVDVDGIYRTLTVNLSEFATDGFDPSQVKGLVFAVDLPSAKVILDIDSIEISE